MALRRRPPRWVASSTVRLEGVWPFPVGCPRSQPRGGSVGNGLDGRRVGLPRGNCGGSVDRASGLVLAGLPSHAPETVGPAAAAGAACQPGVVCSVERWPGWHLPPLPSQSPRRAPQSALVVRSGTLRIGDCAARLPRAAGAGHLRKGGGDVPSTPGTPRLVAVGPLLRLVPAPRRKPPGPSPCARLLVVPSAAGAVGRPAGVEERVAGHATPTLHRPWPAAVAAAPTAAHWGWAVVAAPLTGLWGGSPRPGR